MTISAPALLFIRVDSSPEIGIGHIIRCLAFAQAWKTWGGSAAFISCCENDGVRQRITNEGFDFFPIPTPHPCREDIRQTIEDIRGAESDSENQPWIILDGYHFDSNYQRALQGLGRLLVIDDYGHLGKYHGHLLLNPNIGAEKIPYPQPREATLLLGPDFALLRSEFFKSRTVRTELPDSPHRILITLGGGDAAPVLSKILKGIRLLDGHDLELRIAGAMSHESPELKPILEDGSLKTEFCYSLEEMHRLMAWSDMAVTAGGGTCLELAMMGVPFLVLVLNENQAPGAAEFHLRKVGINLGWTNRVRIEEIAASISRLIEDAPLRETFARNGRALVDGRGAFRVIQSMMQVRIELVRAAPEHCRIVWEWANDPQVRDVSFSSETIPFESHRKWYFERIGLTESPFYIAFNQFQIPLGLIRFDRMEKDWFVSVVLDDRFRRMDLGRHLIRQGSDRFLRETGSGNVYALIKQGNDPSIRAFGKAGYRKVRMEHHRGFETTRMRYGNGA